MRLIMILLLIGIGVFSSMTAYQSIRPPARFTVIQHQYAAADVWLNGAVLIEGLPLGQFSDFQEIYPENHRIAIVNQGGEADDTDTILHTFREGRDYVVIGHYDGEITVLDLTRLRDGFALVVTRLISEGG